MESVALISVALIVLFVFGVYKKIANGEVEVEDDYNDECDYCGEDCDCVETGADNSITQNVFRNRNGKRQRVGVLVSCNKRGLVKIGYSLCHKDDVFDSKEAYIKAGQRMSEAVLTPPHSLRKDLNKFMDRCDRYYKDADIPTYNGVTIKNQ